MNVPVGKVIFVGAGPGDPGLLTLRGLECLQSADVVLYDYLAGSQVVACAHSRAELVCLGRHGRGRLMSQAEINQRLVRHAREGHVVVRLKGGDPGIFGRLGEELAAVQAAGIEYEIVPGISAAQAASSHAGIPLTQRDDASCVAFVTGHESDEKDQALDFRELAKFPGTLVFYMGVTTAASWSRSLIDHGKAPETPVAVVRRCSLPDQQTFLTDLRRLDSELHRRQLRPPAVIIVGEVARRAGESNWFTNRPLFGRTILVTRPEHQTRELTRRLQLLGANVLCQPAITITAPTDWSPVDAVIDRLAEFDWLVFSSSNGVRFFFERLLELGHDLRRLGSVRLAAIGPATAEALAQLRLRVDVQPAAYQAEALATALAPHAPGRRFLLARASRGREALAELLVGAGAIVEQAVVYDSRDVATPDPTIAEELSAGRVDWTLVTSSAIARSVVRMFGPTLERTRLAAISPLTAEALTSLGHAPAFVADTYTTDGIVAGLLAVLPERI